MFTIIGAMAQLERDIIKERVLAGLDRARSKGRRLGRPPRHRPDPVRAAALREQGLSLRAIAKHLGLPASGATAVSRVLSRAQSLATRGA